MTAALVIVGVQSFVTLAAAIGLVVYGSQWLESREQTHRELAAGIETSFITALREMHDATTKAQETATERVLAAYDQLAETGSTERKELLDRIQSPLAPHVQAMASAMPPPAVRPEDAFDALRVHEPDPKDPNEDMDLLLASARNGVSS